MRRVLHSLAVLCIGLGIGGVVQARLAVKVDRTRVAMGETFTLSISTDSTKAHLPDLTELRQRFQVLSTSQQTRVSIMNNQSSTEKMWKIELMPSQQGEVEIPSLQINGERSQPITLAVTAMPTAEPFSATGAASPLAVSASLDHNATVVGAQVVYTVNFITSVNVEQAELHPPTIKGAVINQVGKDEQFTRQVRGAMQQVLRRHYVISPTQAGHVTIAPAVVVAYVPDGTASSDPFSNPFANFTSPMKRMAVQSKPLTLTVEKAQSDHDWLPARQLGIQQSWSRSVRDWHVGDPITRNVTITAQGVATSALPDITAPTLLGMNIYPNQQHATHQFDGATPSASVSRQFAYVPTKPGQVTIPAMSIRWWNMTKRRFDVARLAAQTVTILPAVNAQTQPSASVKQPVPPAAANVSSALPIQAVSSVRPTVTRPFYQQLWFWLFATMMVLWVATLLLWRYSRMRLLAPVAPRTATAERALKQACLANEVKAIQAALLPLARHWFELPAEAGLMALAARCQDDELSALLDQLQQALWSPTSPRYTDGPRLWSVLNRLRSDQKKAPTDDKPESTLPPLY